MSELDRELDKLKRLKAVASLQMTHKHLVSLARTWVGFTKGCNPVFCELGSSEKPDVIGWSGRGSIVVECKISVSDFRADLKKDFRTDNGSGMGKFRYYMFTDELYKVLASEVPVGWGIVTVDSFSYARQVYGQGSKTWDHNVKAERDYLRNRVIGIQNYGR